METTNRKSQKMKITVIALIGVVVILLLALALFLLPKGTLGSVKKALESKDEYTMNLDEFVVNLQPNGRSKSYLKVEVSVMYTDKKEVKNVETSQSKIRDIVLNKLRTKTADQMLDVEETDRLKEEIRTDINNALKKEVIKEVYYTNLIIQ